MAAGTWVHVAISWNYNALAGSNQDSLSVYVNGVATTVQFSSNGTLPTSAGYLYLGDSGLGLAHGKGSVNSADGVIDEVQLYNYVLSSTQVGVLMSATRTCTSLTVDQWAKKCGITQAAMRCRLRLLGEGKRLACLYRIQGQ